MARVSHQYCLHLASERAFVVLDNERVYLGKFGTEESKQRYRLVLADWKTTEQIPTNRAPAALGISINEVLVEYLRHCETYNW